VRGQPVSQPIHGALVVAKKKRPVSRATTRRRSRKGASAKKAASRKRSSVRPHSRTGRKRATKKVSKRSTARKVDKTSRGVNATRKKSAPRKLPEAAHPATKKRGADPDVPSKNQGELLPRTPEERKLEQGLEESMAGSDPVSITQPSRPIAESEHPAEPSSAKSPTDE
jgi:hypothetical protein